LIVSVCSISRKEKKEEKGEGGEGKKNMERPFGTGVSWRGAQESRAERVRE